VEEGDKWTRQWLAQKGTILTILSSPDEGAATRGGYDLLLLAKYLFVCLFVFVLNNGLQTNRVAQSAAPDAFGAAVTCWFGEFNTLVFAPERGHHAYWMTGLGMVLDKYKVPILKKRKKKKKL
jgi:hypothetical protein